MSRLNWNRPRKRATHERPRRVSELEERANRILRLADEFPHVETAAELEDRPPWEGPRNIPADAPRYKPLADGPRPKPEDWPRADLKPRKR